MKPLFRHLRLAFLALHLVNSGWSAGAPSAEGVYAEITTPRGIITCELFFEKAPMTVASFVGLAEGTLGPTPRKPFFDGLTFHRVVPGFVIQGGDPLGSGEGGPGYTFPDEFVPGLRHNAVGILSMANSGPDTNGSQFFLTLAPVNRLNYLHSVFGRTVAGLELLPQIKAGDTMSVKIIRRGPNAEKFQADEKSFAKLMAGASRATPPAFDDVSGLLQTEPPRASALNTKLTNFARFTHVPLFVRLYEKFEASAPQQTVDEFVESLGRSLPLGAKGVLVVGFATENKWLLFAPGRPGLQLPPLTSAPSATSTALGPVVDRQRRVLTALNEVVEEITVKIEEADKIQ